MTKIIERYNNNGNRNVSETACSPELRDATIIFDHPRSSSIIHLHFFFLFLIIYSHLRSPRTLSSLFSSPITLVLLRNVRFFDFHRKQADFRVPLSAVVEESRSHCTYGTPPNHFHE